MCHLVYPALCLLRTTSIALLLYDKSQIQCYCVFQYYFTMPLCEGIPTTAALQDLVREAALLLETPDVLGSITQLFTVSGSKTEMFRFGWNSKYDALTKEVIEVTVCRKRSSISARSLSHVTVYTSEGETSRCGCEGQKPNCR